MPKLQTTNDDLVWLRVALVFYAAGLLYALVALARTSSTSETLGKIALHASYLGMVFHFVSLTEAVVQTGQIATARCTIRSRCSLS